MYLRSLELQGFKSFPDKTKLTFNKGISAVVGPNGSGKSNIGDAMRWVLGEQSSKSLRGKTMEDVIFSGTLHRPKSSFAQVIITIDNADGALKTEDEVVSVSRKLYRSGDSEYQINGKAVRLKDVTELFMDTGLGKDGYSIIGQGKIDEIVSSKAGDRRQIFDEAAGISKFRSRKEETERKLLAAEDNISRLTDILSELENRIGPLKRQCEKAKQFKLLDDERSQLEVSLWVNRLSELTAAQKQFAEKLRAQKAEYEQISQTLDELDESIEKGFADAAAQGARAEEHREKIHEIELRNSQAAAKTAVIENDIEHLNSQIAQLRDSIEQSKSSGYFLQTRLEERTAALADLQNDREQAAAQAAECEQALGGAAEDLSQAATQTERLSAELNALYLKRSNAAFRLETAKNSAAAALEALGTLGEEKQTYGEKLDMYSAELEKLTAAEQRLTTEQTELANRTAGFEKLYQSKSAKLKEAGAAMNEDESRLRGANQRLGILRDLENAMEGFSYSVKFIMKAAAAGRISGVCGSIAQLISVPDEYSTAVETALGGALQNIAVENEDGAKRAIRLLKEAKAGRATFLPLTSVNGRLLNDAPQGEFGYVALAAELVSCDERYKGLIRSLLGRVAVAEDIDAASAIARKYGYRFKIVTLDGQVVNAGGSYTGGSVSKSAGILTRKNEISELERTAQKLTADIAEQKTRCEKLSQEAQKLAAELEGGRARAAEIKNDMLRNSLEQKRVSQAADELKNGADKLNESLEKQQKLLADSEEQSQQAAQEMQKLEGEIGGMESELSQSREKNAAAAEQRTKLSQQLSELKIAEAELSKDIEACKDQLKQINDSIEAGRGDESRLLEEIAACETAIADKKAETQRIADEAAGSGDETAALEEQINAARRRQYELNAEAEKLRAEQKNKMNERETLSADMTRLSERDANLKSEFDKLVGKLWNEHGLTRTEAAEQYEPPEDVSAAGIRLNELKTQIRSLGSVNLGAIEEYAEVSERYEFMTSQLGDVQKSKRELEELIESLTENMKSIFTESFDRINKHFSDIFVELFGGGKASLSLTDPENVLECGIDINVAPPGKVIKNLMALSGGEKAFIAVCIYFAILTVRPSPFCLLDEIEAALDDVNVAKYAAYLRKFTDKTQFIAITHRRGTMEEADVLYGVTMQEDGVSKLLKMDMDEAKTAAAAAAK